MGNVKVWDAAATPGSRNSDDVVEMLLLSSAVFSVVLVSVFPLRAVPSKMAANTSSPVVLPEPLISQRSSRHLQITLLQLGSRALLEPITESKKIRYSYQHRKTEMLFPEIRRRCLAVISRTAPRNGALLCG